MKKIIESKNLIIELTLKNFILKKKLTSNCVEFLKKNNFKYFYELQ